MDASSDSYLFKQITRNNQKSFEQLFRRYYTRLCNFSLRYVYNKDTSEEIVSDVFLNIWIKRNELRIEQSPKAYLYAAVKNRSINFLDLKKESFENIDSALALEHASGNWADAKINYTETLHRLEKIIEKLPEKRREIFKMSRVDGLPYSEIAEILSVSVSTVQKQMTASIRFISKYHKRGIYLLFRLLTGKA